MEIQKEIELFEEILLANPDFDEALLSKDESDDYEDSSIADQLGFFQAGIEVAEREARMGAKAKAVPENKIEFDGEYIKYPNSYAIHCQFDEDFDCHIFDVYQNEDCVKDGMTQLKQAHLFVFSMSEAQDLTND